LLQQFLHCVGPLEGNFDVFICHTGAQKDFAIQLRGTFERLGITTFVDKTELFPGAGNADAQMEEAVRRAHVGVAILSKAFLLKHAPMRKLKIIAQRDNLLPVLYDITYEQLDDLLPKSEILERLFPGDLLVTDFKEKVVCTTALLNVEDKQFSEVLCQRIAFAVIRRLVDKCPNLVLDEAERNFLDRMQRVLEKVVDGEKCLLDISKANVLEAKLMLSRVKARIALLCPC
jgi:hypothetical protein